MVFFKLTNISCYKTSCI